MEIVIIGGWGETGMEMAFYVDRKLKGIAEIDGTNDSPHSVNDFLYEFGLRAAETNITDPADLDKKPDIVTQDIPVFTTEEEVELFKKAHPDVADKCKIGEDYPFAEDLTDDMIIPL